MVPPILKNESYKDDEFRAKAGNLKGVREIKRDEASTRIF